MHHCAQALSLFKQSPCEGKSSPGALWECFREAEGAAFAPSSGHVFGVLLVMHPLSCAQQGWHRGGLHPSAPRWCGGTAPVRDGELRGGERLLLLPLCSTSSGSGVRTRTRVPPPAREAPSPALRQRWACIGAGLSQASPSPDPFCPRPALPRAPRGSAELGAWVSPRGASAGDQPAPPHHGLHPGEAQVVLRERKRC